jgi:6-pyruvoyltetrahydropterin/6-carboxytetrahydropterin synthase
MSDRSTIFAKRYHDIACGHRVYGHESKCANLHGHNYRIHFTVSGKLDALGRVMDFSAIKELLCHWLEEHWDHRFLLWEKDPALTMLRDIDPSVVAVPFNPTAENISNHLLTVIGPQQLADTDIKLVSVVVEETRKCSSESLLEL